MSCCIRCCTFCLCDILWCQCNCLIFPATNSEYDIGSGVKRDDSIQWQIKSFNSEGRMVPYFKVSTKRSRESKKCFIYFHGNAEDIGYAGYFLDPLCQATDITFYAIQYPSYGLYDVLFPALISNTIKRDAINFYHFLKQQRQMKRGDDDIYIMGRSIGSGGASYLAGNTPASLLILMSPFDTIRSVAKDIVGCLGCIVKQHFNNQQEIVKFNGHLLLIHGQADQVIGVSHGKNLSKVYETGNPYRNTAVKNFPINMSHNKFHMQKDIVKPIVQFLREHNLLK